MEVDVAVKDWVSVMELLGSSPSSHALPAVVPCLACGGKRMTVFEDSRIHSTWHHCFDCKFGGDIVDLAAQAWRTERQRCRRENRPRRSWHCAGCPICAGRQTGSSNLDGDKP